MFYENLRIDMPLDLSCCLLFFTIIGLGKKDSPYFRFKILAGLLFAATYGESRMTMSVQHRVYATLPSSLRPCTFWKQLHCRAVNNTGKKYWQYQYQYFQIKVLAIPIPILK